MLYRLPTSTQMLFLSTADFSNALSLNSSADFDPDALSFNSTDVLPNICDFKSTQMLNSFQELCATVYNDDLKWRRKAFQRKSRDRETRAGLSFHSNITNEFMTTGILSQHYSRKQIEPSSTQFISKESVPDKEITLRAAVGADST
ncbi:hypothetical protein DdX_20141 [Ditylenchus destructor]|uniref:Uncharacterized protein n=1 Tax=Ditylenchus destructor TaxID=166010 RepID=A0AAD4MHP7_9BILA|nr:hypothetical protein DdX_20141 [Ditylenchus destructor]